MRAPAIALAAALAAGCGGGGGGDETPDAAEEVDVCTVSTGEVSFVADDDPCEKLSSYGFFVGSLADLEPNDGVVPYDLNSPLFSDYAAKYRAVWLPPGATMTYEADASFDVPVGGVILKTFAMLADLREPDGPRRLLETRLLYRTSAGWDVTTYVWDEDQREAHRKVAGDTLAVSWTHSDGAMRENDYEVPDENQCKNCHEEIDDTVGPIGPKARHLNRDHDYGSGPENQLAHLVDVGYLAGAPADPAADAPRAPVWDDEATGTLDARARAWLEINCAHCHNPRGAARTSGLDLRASQDNPVEYGVCKTPVAAGSGSGGRQYNIVPGQPDESILVYRIESTEPDIMMPELGRRLVHDEGVALVRAWIESLEGSCGAN